MGDWKGMIDFFSVLLDDFDFILGNDFFQRAKVALLPHLIDHGREATMLCGRHQQAA